MIVAPGNYDGVHRGHQVLIARAQALAGRLGCRTRVLSFYPHPTALLAPERAPEPLTTPERRRELLLAYGIDTVEIAAFTKEYAAQSPTAFLDRLHSHGARGVVVGHDFRFGQRAAGTPEMLAEWGRKHAVEVDVVPPVIEGGVRISSTAVRNALAAGAVERATELMGHAHDVTGRVIPGDQRGRALGFPTANLSGVQVLRPADGVYAVQVRRLDRTQERQLLPAVANLGTRPTFEAGYSLEVHLLHFDEPLYGEVLRVGFVKRLRAERRFEGIEALKAQINRDCEAAEQALQAADQGPLAWI